MPSDVFKILKDLELKAVGLDEKTNKMQEGYFVSFRSIGLPIHMEDFENPYDPLGGNLEKTLEKVIQKKDPVDPKDAPKTASGQVDENKILAAGIAKSQKNYLNTFLLTDSKLKMSNQYTVMQNSSKLSDTWFAIISGANGIPTESVISDDLKKAYEEAASKIMDKDGNESPHYQAYRQRQEEYKSKVRALNKAYADAFTNPMKLQNWPMEGKLYQDDVNDAWDRWEGFGFKEEIENALATLAAQGTDPAIALISRAKKRFNNSLLQFMGVGEIPYVLLLPSTWYDRNNEDGWTEYTSQDYHNEGHYSASSTSYGGGGSFDIGFWSAGASFEHSEEDRHSVFKVSNLEISFKYCAVDIFRPGIDTTLLNLKNWFLMGDYKKNCISNGTMGQELPSAEAEHTFLPSIVTSLILAKDLSIKWDNWQSEWQAHSESTSASASIGFGPFAVSGHYNHHGASTDFECDASGESLSVPGIQLIGYISTIMPPSPGVDSAPYMK